LVTLTGIGGIGKTRLALAVAERVGPTMADGLAFLPLAPVLDEALLWPELGRALGVDAVGSTEDAEGLLAAAASLEMLLLLDNCEHLPGVGGVVTDLLDRCPGLQVLATSRAPLRVRAETEYLIQPLRLPQPGTVDLSRLTDSPAATLLLERGRAVRRDLNLRVEDAPAVVGICHRLAGLPLALELAAIGLRVLDPPTLLTHLDEVLGRGGPIDLPARQRTMRATLDWSYELLGPRDQAVFRRASVFVGGFSLPAASMVLGDAGMLDALDTLVAQSLCTTSSSVDGGVRYGMLEPVAQYACSLLGDEEEMAARLAHAGHFLEQAERAEREMYGPHFAESLRLFDTEESNLWSALEWSTRTGQDDLAARFVWALFAFWWIRGRRDRGRRLVAQVLELDLSDAHRTKALHAAAGLSEPGLVEAHAAESLYLESMSLAAQAGDREVEARSAIGAGLMALERRDWAAAEHRLQRGVSVAQQVGQHAQWYEGWAHTWLAAARRFQGKQSSALAHGTQALVITDRFGAILARSAALSNLAYAELGLGDYDRARKHLIEAVTVCQQTRDLSNLSYALDALAAVESQTGGRESVATLLGAAEGQREAVGSTAYRWCGPDIELRQRNADAAGERLGHDAYQRAFDGGYSLTLDGAVELARRQIPTTE
jgi:predicted ATPase